MENYILALTKGGNRLAETLAAELDDCTIAQGQGRVADKIQALWSQCDGLICIMAAGIVVRSIAPLLADKRSDPCVIVLDEKGRHVISLLSGHLGGGNALAHRIAHITGGVAVITTASDVLGKTAIDLWAERNGLFVTDKKKLTAISAKHVNSGPVTLFYAGGRATIPADFRAVNSPEIADIIIAYKQCMTFEGLYCIPRNLYLGIGCNRGTSLADIELSFKELCHEHKLHPQAIAGIASIDLKSDEKGILQFAEKYQYETHFFSRGNINSVQDVSFSKVVMAAVGVQGVAEPTAILAAGREGSQCRLLVQKMKWKDVTLAVAERKITQWE